ncbi:ArsR/SmtB family transcription factor [Salinigranum halophilum]|jgi:DNA-binding transcriptional ArsR family regulator|uniref:ArsR/SmtB family transcription factor n=1 Tax=Salinigranum halophilum TaxID=2565931 RepID=UPI00191BCF6D
MKLTGKRGVVNEDPPPAKLFALLDDEYARRILAHLDQEPMSATELSERCDASPPTVYRRLDRLQRCGLLTEETRIDDRGNHYAVYESRFEGLAVVMDDGEFVVDLSRRADPADRFTNLWEGMR